jgi:DNA-binding response OmpR family regulator
MKTILIVDDEEGIAKLLGENLTEDGYKVVLAMNGEDGLRKAQIAKPDLVILDVMMPKMDGAEVCSRLRENARTKELPIIFMTGLKTKNDDFQIGRDIGNHTIFSKPFDYEELLGTVREMTADSIQNGTSGGSVLKGVARKFFGPNKK